MRLDKFLKVSRIIKRRTVANEAASTGLITINDKPAKPGSQLKIGDIITINYGTSPLRAKVLSLDNVVRKEDADKMYEVL